MVKHIHQHPPCIWSLYELRKYALFPDFDPGFELLSQQVRLSKRSRYDIPAGAMQAH